MGFRKRSRTFARQTGGTATWITRRAAASGAADVATPNNRPRVPLIVLSGFLGTGKTTLLKYWLEHAQSRIGVVVNDVASVNIDAKLVKQQKVGAGGSVDTIQLQNGCACCNLGDELLVTIHDLLALAGDKDEPFTHIVVELSGIAEPRRVRENLEQAALSGLNFVSGVELKKVVTVLDSSTFCSDYMEAKRIWERQELVEDTNSEVADFKVVDLLVEQAEAADVLVLNKTDLASEKDLEVTQAVLKALNDKAYICQTSFGKVALNTVLADLEPATASRSAQQGREEQRPADHGHAEHGHEAHGHEDSHGHGHDPNCTDPSHGHSHGHEGEGSEHGQGHGHVQAAASSSTTAEDRFGIKSFIYSARRPFHDGRLHELLQKWPVSKKNSLGSILLQPPSKEGHPFSRVIRSKGFLWMDTYPSSRLYWGHAGKSLVLEYDGLWWGSMQQAQLLLLQPGAAAEYQRAKREDWHSEFADRRQELVFIGQKMDEGAICTMLDECLLRDDELEEYLQRQESDKLELNNRFEEQKQGMEEATQALAGRQSG